jgi:hypothetical protein
MQGIDNPIFLWDYRATMKSTDILEQHFGNRAKTIAALGINPETWRLWMRDGIPLSKALMVEKKSKSAVTAEMILNEARRMTTS